MRLAADLVVVVHLAFILFVMFGGLLVWKWPKMAWLPLPAVAWGAFVEFTGSVCPLTPLENRLRAAHDGGAYGDSFIQHYVVPLVYPPGMTASTVNSADRYPVPNRVNCRRIPWQRNRSPVKSR